jgi:hypothetical protein
LPRRVFFGFIATTVVGVIALVAYSIASGWVPRRFFASTHSAVLLPLYFATLVAVVTLSFVISGNTLMHHYRTGTVRRATSPAWFWSIVIVQTLVALGLAVVGFVNWSGLPGR